MNWHDHEIKANSSLDLSNKNPAASNSHFDKKKNLLLR